MPSLVLASASIARARLLREAGIEITVAPVGIDESAVKQSLAAEKASADDVATILAETKAARGSLSAPGALVLGADQMLSCGDAWFDKPPDLDHARAQLKALRGKAHRLHCAAALARDGQVIWRHVERASLHMRDFTDGFLDGYVAAEGEALLTSVGAYRLEGPGVQLFSRIDGDHFVIQGLPLLALLEQLRALQVLAR
ncbi:Maf family protein [Desertibaculum subflavum]|uniref:Maf family protein n=1 Tax=Desertibaculum subflavum TaxID=2268458 RepID=UPI000E671A92